MECRPLVPGAKVEHARFGAGLENSDHAKAALPQEDELSGWVLRECKPLSQALVDEDHRAGVLVINEGERTAHRHGAVFHFVPGWLDAVHRHVVLRFAAVSHSQGLLDLPGEGFDRRAMLEHSVEIGDVKPVKVSARIAFGRPLIIRHDEHFVSAERLERVHELGLEPCQAGNHRRHRRDANHDADGREERARLVGPDLSDRQKGALKTEQEQ